MYVQSHSQSWKAVTVPDLELLWGPLLRKLVTVGEYWKAPRALILIQTMIIPQNRIDALILVMDILNDMKVVLGLRINGFSADQCAASLTM